MLSDVSIASTGHPASDTLSWLFEAPRDRRCRSAVSPGRKVRHRIWGWMLWQLCDTRCTVLRVETSSHRIGNNIVKPLDAFFCLIFGKTDTQPRKHQKEGQLTHLNWLMCTGTAGSQRHHSSTWADEAASGWGTCSTHDMHEWHRSVVPARTKLSLSMWM